MRWDTCSYSNPVNKPPILAVILKLRTKRKGLRASAVIVKRKGDRGMLLAKTCARGKETRNSLWDTLGEDLYKKKETRNTSLMMIEKTKKGKRRKKKANGKTWLVVTGGLVVVEFFSSLRSIVFLCKLSLAYYKERKG